ncbi:MAG: Rrf2 family transcriptional regulator [Bacillota bacterium]|nr:Rrf2 family transcriptional regulator [Bacillota bacterium]
MKLSTKGRYGLMAMEVLKDSYGKGPVSVSTVAEEKNISEAYLEQLFSLMKKHGLLKSLRGAQGGYELARSPEEITIEDILVSLEGQPELSCCDGTSDKACVEGENCRMKSILDRIEDGISEVTASIKLSEL